MSPAAVRKASPLHLRSSRFLFALAAAVIALAASCSPGRDSPEAQVRKFLRQGVAAAERKDIAALRKMISENYRDSQGRDRRAVQAILRHHFLRHEAIYLLPRIREIAFPEPSRAQAVVYVAMAGQPIHGVKELDPLRAGFHRFEISLTREKDGWKVARAEWRRAEMSDFL